MEEFAVCQSCAQHSVDLIMSCCNDEHDFIAYCLSKMISMSYQQLPGFALICPWRIVECCTSGIK